MLTLVLGALSWNPQVKGALYVILALIILPGSAFLLLSTNMGARLGFLLAAAGFFGWMTAQGGIWWVYGQGYKGKEPSWKIESVVNGDIARNAQNDALEGFPEDWEKLEPSDPAVLDAQPVADSRLVGPRATFRSASDYVLLQTAKTGGETYGPLHLLNFRPFDVFHEPHYLVIQVQKALPQEAAGGQPPPTPQPDPSAEPVAVLLVRDLGNLRLYPALITLSCGAIFGVICYTLHQRDKEAAASRE
ncbi:MAG TPA: hypothetical protein VG078_09585 [Acidimicrobiales bacterium]|nr:hypothetical protein [Acidimicrobiales bacterium]